MPVRRHVLEGGDSSIQNFGDGIMDDMASLSAEDIAYTPTTAADWVAPLPTTVQEALDRLAAAGGVTPVP